MLKIGLFTFGCGYAMIALLENELVVKKAWIGKDEFVDMVAIAESTPGPVAINVATYIGYTLAGFAGSLVATVAVCIPSFVIIYLISLFFDAFLSLEYVAYAFAGIRVCVIYLILTAGIKLFSQLEKKAFNYIIATAVIVCMSVLSLFAVSFSTVFYILICGFVGIFFMLVRRISNGRVEK